MTIVAAGFERVGIGILSTLLCGRMYTGSAAAPDLALGPRDGVVA